jgi:Kef-type K+ transport system membrane component KefB
MSAPAANDTPRARVMSATRGLLSLTLIIIALVVVRRAQWGTVEGGGLFALGFLLVAGTVGGRVAAFLRMPRLTGYLAVGVLAGPFGPVPLFNQDDVQDLTLINGLALALIALQAGAELTIPMLKRSLKSLLYASLGHVLIITIGMAVLFALLLPYTTFGAELGLSAALAIGLLWGAMACSKAPADTLAILGETRAKGPLAEHALGVVVLLDVLVLVLFAVALVIARGAVDPSVQFDSHVLALLGEEIFASVAAGTTFGLGIAFYFWAIGREKLLFTVVVAYGVTAFCAYFHYDTLLVFVVAGFVVMNLTDQGHELIHTTESAGAAVMVVFFATAGAQLDLTALKTTWPIATSLAFGRIGFTWLACRFGHVLAKDPPTVRKYAFTSFISQAGVTIGLAAIAREAIGGELGNGIATLVIAVIGINELIGPIAFKLGLTRAGEVGKALSEPAPPSEAAPAPPSEAATKPEASSGSEGELGGDEGPEDV